MIMLLLASAFAEDPTSVVDVPAAAPAAAVPAAAVPEATSPGAALAPTPKPTDPRSLRLDGFLDTPMALRLGGSGVQTGAIEHRFQVVGPNGPMSVTELLRTVNDPEVARIRKREVTLGVILGSVGVATAASMLAVHSIEEVNNDPVAEPVTAVAGTLGFVVGVVAFGQPLQSDGQPWRYWTAETLRPKVDAYNAALSTAAPMPPAAPPPAEPAPVPDVEAPALPAPGEQAPFLPDKPIDLPDVPLGHPP
ncbi:hypothetical protein LBMAG42_42940 [Deltaproteobacteria bacterium]|nr:hypothetical protein LBMAG42_42940 [Deltaproteobacteria bacterium]